MAPANRVWGKLPERPPEVLFRCQRSSAPSVPLTQLGSRAPLHHGPVGAFCLVCPWVSHRQEGLREGSDWVTVSGAGRQEKGCWEAEAFTAWGAVSHPQIKNLRLAPASPSSPAFPGPVRRAPSCPSHAAIPCLTPKELPQLPFSSHTVSGP